MSADDREGVHVLAPVAYRPDVTELCKRLRIKEGSPNQREFQRLLAEAEALARPRAMYRVVSAVEHTDVGVVLAGRHFASRVMRANLEGVFQVFPYLATCGVELQDWAERQEDMLLRYWAEAIKESALGCALAAMYEDLQARYQPGKTASMNPGSLEDWPIQEQPRLFDLLGEAVEQVGVRLNASLLMVPTKSVSGICFPSETGFESCQLCPREDCPGRRAPYDPALAAAHFGAF